MFSKLVDYCNVLQKKLNIVWILKCNLAKKMF